MSLDALPQSTRNAFFSDLRVAKTWELQAHVASTQRHAATAWRCWQYFCQEHNFKTDLSGCPSPIAALQVFLVRIRQRRYDKGGKEPIRADTVSKHLSAIVQENGLLVDTTLPGQSIWTPGAKRPLAIAHLLRAFARTDPAPNRVWPINTTILVKLLTMRRPSKYSEEQWEAIKDLAIMGFFYLLRPGEYAYSVPTAKEKDSHGKPFRVKHVSFLLTNGKYQLGHQMTTLGRKRCNDFKPEAIKIAALSFDDQKSTAKGDKVCQQYRGGMLCPGEALY